MKLIVGLGNPGKEYEGTRHNAGFMFLDALVSGEEISSNNNKPIFSLDKKLEAEIAQTQINSLKIIFAKPQTFMNSSGRSVKRILDYYKIETKDMIVISDDIDLPIGTLRIRKEGASGGQKGLEDIIASTGKEDFVRFRIGISAKEKVDKIETANYVLGKFSKRELPIVEDIISTGVNYLIEFAGSNKEIPCHTLESKFDSLV